jgi:hypothetical protein
MEVAMVPDPNILISKLDIHQPLIGVYDAPDPKLFEPLVKPTSEGQHQCVFLFFKRWQRGETLHLHDKHLGCGGCGRCMFNKQARERDEFLTFLAEEEGLKVSKELMGNWLDHDTPYQPEYGNIFIGHIHHNRFEFLKTITFWVNPDQLSSLVIGANYFSKPEDAYPPVIAPFGSGCMQLLSLFKDLDYPQAIIGSTDIAMRPYIPADLMAFTVTVPMFRQLCQLDEKSFLFKPFLKNLQKSRK